MGMLEPLSAWQAGQKGLIRIRYTSRIGADAGYIDDVVVYIVWVSAEHGPSDHTEMHPLPIRGVGGDDAVAVTVQAPEQPGNWDIHAFACRQSTGPASSSATYAAICSVQVE